ncbi:Sfh5 protein [Saccharomycopsis crataegensis]|uniref:Phosphatidylinositol transfer protein SFH5 n=1 Tax=Saccharomycopsis crataegensis TaxID=43959 RepID=A0AAV5QHM1_9ASCO|nr:Sfh5 protein [Saccharomycopsis crataegensis]
MSDYPETVILPTEQSKKTFEQFLTKIPDIIKDADYDELYGYQLNPEGKSYNAPVAQALLFKYFKANDYKLTESIAQLTASLKWRKEFKPLKAAYYETHDEKYKNIGYLTYKDESPANLKVITWNLYGLTSPDVKNAKDYFKDLDGFVRWRIGLMEQAIGLLDFTNKENNYVAQIHDYSGVSFLSSDSSVKKIGKKVVQLFQAHYPEFLSAKYFLNFPFVLAWIYNFIVKNWFISAETVKKFHILHSGKDLVKEFKVPGLPKKYGGNGGDLKSQNYDVKLIKLSPYTEEILKRNFENEADDVD